MTYSTVSSHFLHIQRTALMYNGGMLIGMCIELVVRVHTACHVSCIALVILDKLLKRECLTGISLDALHDALAADGAIVGDVVVHAGVLLRAEHATVVHIAALVDVNDVAVSVVEDKMAPAYIVHLARKREIVIPAERLRTVKFHDMTAAGTAASIDEGIVIDVFIAELAESVTACLMLNHATRVERIAVCAKRAEGYGPSGHIWQMPP